jgi:hypothetical protein
MGYKFEYVPTPLSFRGVGMYIDNTLEYVIIEKHSNEAFPALWIEIINSNKKNIICGIIYRQHNNPDRFLTYFNEKVEQFSATGKLLCVMGDFNVDLLKSGSCNYAQDFLNSCQSFSLLPTIDKSTRINNNSATLIDVFVNTFDQQITSGNIVSDISDHYSQFCIMQSTRDRGTRYLRSKKVRDFSQFSENKFLSEFSEISWNDIIQKNRYDANKLFSTFYNKFNKLLNKHVPYKSVTHRDIKKFSKPWITNGLKKSIKEKNRLLSQGDHDKYKYYRNRISTLIRNNKKHWPLQKYSIEYYIEIFYRIFYGIF